MVSLSPVQDLPGVMKMQIPGTFPRCSGQDSWIKEFAAGELLGWVSANESPRVTHEVVLFTFVYLPWFHGNIH